MDENRRTETEALLTWLKTQELRNQNLIQKELETLPEIDLAKALETARKAVLVRIKALVTAITDDRRKAARTANQMILRHPPIITASWIAARTSRKRKYGIHRSIKRLLSQ